VDRLGRAARRLPRGRRSELVDEIEAHLDEAIAPSASDAEVLSVLDRLGPPEQIAAAEAPAPSDDPRGLQEWAAIVLLHFGGIIAGVCRLGGVVLLWGADAWSTREKWIGTLVVPGGVATFLLALGFGALGPGATCTGGSGEPEACTGGLSTGAEIASGIVLLVLLVAPFVSAVYLARRAGGRAGRPAGT
jgi:hypothetical protein